MIQFTAEKSVATCNLAKSLQGRRTTTTKDTEQSRPIIRTQLNTTWHFHFIQLSLQGLTSIGASDIWRDGAYESKSMLVTHRLTDIAFCRMKVNSTFEIECSKMESLRHPFNPLMTSPPPLHLPPYSHLLLGDVQEDVILSLVNLQRTLASPFGCFFQLLSMQPLRKLSAELLTPV